MGYKIAIDGPSGTGKGYVAREISKKLGILNIDTGAMYRAFALYCKENNVDLSSESKINGALNNVKIHFEYNEDNVKVFLNNRDVSEAIRTEEIGLYAAKVSSIIPVRRDMVERQRALAGTQNVLMEGRDIGSVVFPDAELKIFLTADADVRAHRRYKDLVLKNKNITLEEVKADIKRRDEQDLTKAISPLIKTEDMIELDTTNLSKQEVLDEVLKLIKEKGLVKW